MKKGLWAALLTAGLLLSGTSFGQLAASGDARILAAREALRKGERNTLEALAALPDSHVLDVYVHYWLLFNKLARSEPPPAAELDAFLAAEAGSVLAERLRAEWLRRLAKDGDWANFIRLYPALQNPDAELRCQAWTARLMTGDRSALDEVAAQWPALTDSHAACDTVLRAAFETGAVGEDQVWGWARRQIDSRSPASARATLAWLAPDAAPDWTEFDHAIRSPAPWLDRLPANFGVHRSGRELALAALVRLARTDARAAYVRLLRLQDRLGADERSHAYAALAMHAAIDQLPEAPELFRAAVNAELTPLQRAWRVRAVCRARFAPRPSSGQSPRGTSTLSAAP